MAVALLLLVQFVSSRRQRAKNILVGVKVFGDFFLKPAQASAPVPASASEYWPMGPTTTALCARADAPSFAAVTMVSGNFVQARAHTH